MNDNYRSFPQKLFLGKRFSGMRITCPIQRSCSFYDEDLDAEAVRALEDLDVWNAISPCMSTREFAEDYGCETRQTCVGYT